MSKRSFWTAVFVGSLIVVGLLSVAPAWPQQVDGSESDPGFAHNHSGLWLSGTDSGFRHDPSAHCTALPEFACGGVPLSELLRQGRDPFFPQKWEDHRGNDAVLRHAVRRGLPLQTLEVRAPDGSPVPEVSVRFYQAGYMKTGVVGRTDENGEFMVLLRKAGRNHRFLVEAAGYRRIRLDVFGTEMGNDNHFVVLEPVARRADSIWEATNGPHLISVMGSSQVPEDLAGDYEKALEAMQGGALEEAMIGLQTLIERWPVGVLQDGGSYDPRQHLITVLEESGQSSLAETLRSRAVVVTTGVARGTG